MRRHGFREVKGEIRDCGYYGERRDTSSSNNQAYKNIKPESDITLEEAQNFWDNFFANLDVDNLPDQIGETDGLDELPDEILI